MLKEVDGYIGRRLASMGRRKVVATTMEWIREEISRAEPPSPVFKPGDRRQMQPIQLFGVEIGSWSPREKPTCTVFEDDRSPALFDPALSNTKQENTSAPQFGNEREVSKVRSAVPLLAFYVQESIVWQYFNEVDAAAVRRLEIYNHGLQLKLNSVGGEILRFQNRLQLVNHDIEMLRAQADFLMLEGEALGKRFVSDINLLGEQLKNTLSIDQ
ncbi:hypothetical protein B0H13DRAFT_1922006 [Mycena leptocephala]|nr:hypothetical protein B0H13DRAFT_1922006 [Mycena leptocephala]